MRAICYLWRGREAAGEFFGKILSTPYANPKKYAKIDPISSGMNMEVFIYGETCL